jgi:hypothetical protein
MDDGSKHSGLILYIAIGIVVAAMTYRFVKAFQASPPEPHALVHDSK